MTFAVGKRGDASDAYVLARQNNRWEVFYTERGCDSAPIFTSQSERAACLYFIKHVTSQPQWHLVGWFKKEVEATTMEEIVKALGARPVRNDIPNYAGFDDPRYRVFVFGKDIFAVRAAFPTSSSR